MLPDKKPMIMGILNVTPDSYWDGGRYQAVDDAVQRALQMQAEGADIIDVGGESTRPNADYVSEADELARVIPVIEALSDVVNIPLAIDSYKPKVIAAALAAGATMINDIRALQEPGALEVAAASEVPICLMHMQGRPQTMQQQPHYQNVVDEVYSFFQQRITACEQAGIDPQRLILDIGFGFGKTPAHNLSLIKHLSRFRELDLPLLVGVSRKSTIGHVLDREVAERLPGSLAMTALAVERGASIIRTHDVAATHDAIAIVLAVEQAI